MIVLIELGMGLLLSAVVFAALDELVRGFAGRRRSRADATPVTPFRAEEAKKRAHDVEAA